MPLDLPRQRRRAARVQQRDGHAGDGRPQHRVVDDAVRRDRQVQKDVLTLDLVQRMRPDAHLEIQVAWLATVETGTTLTRETDPFTVGYPARDPDLEFADLAR